MQEVLIATIAGVVAGWLASLLMPATGLRYVGAGICGAFYGVVVFANVPLFVEAPLVVESLLAIVGAFVAIVGIRFSKWS